MKTLCSTARWLLLISSLSLPLCAEDWPQWRGPFRTAKSPEGTPVPETLPRELKTIWRKPVGSGHSSPVVAGERLVYLDEQEGKETVHVLEAGSGKELWSAPFDEAVGDEWGSGPRSTPFIDGDRVYVQSCRGEFRCLNLEDGKVLWGISFEKDYGIRFVGSKAGEGTAARRGNNGSGIVEGDRVYVPVGSPDGASIVCFDKLTGKELWRSQNDEAAYSSFIVTTLADTKQLVAFTADALIGLDLGNGKVFWRVPFKTAAKRHAATPVVFEDSVIVNSHTFGLVSTRVTRGEDGSFAAEEAWANKALRINLATSVEVDGHLYIQGARKDYVCVDARTGEVKWSQEGFGRGTKDYSSTLVLGENLLILTEAGELVMIAANSEKYVELGRLQICGSTWSFPAYVDGNLYVRDGRELACIELTPASSESAAGL